MTLTLSSLLDVAPVVPVVVLSDETQAVPLARALAAGGLPIIELTLRTPAALGAIRRIADEVPDILVGAGTVLNGQQAELAAAASAGKNFSSVSPRSATASISDTVETPGR